uniref:NUDIX hydrolase n=1 Tax=Agathobacter sp. TaxID=2021311 RepID=UPI0040578070
MELITQLQNYIPYNEQEKADKELMLQYVNAFRDVLTRENKLCHFTASNWIVNKEHTKILMAYHNIYQSWAWTGGHADGEADLCAVARKEAEEETGIKELKLLSDGIYAIEILTVNSHKKRGQFISCHLHLDCCFLWEADDADMVRAKADENSGVAWIPIEDVLEVTKEEHMKPIYAKLNQKLEAFL